MEDFENTAVTAQDSKWRFYMSNTLSGNAYNSVEYCARLVLYSRLIWQNFTFWTIATEKRLKQGHSMKKTFIKNYPNYSGYNYGFCFTNFIAIRINLINTGMAALT